MSKLKTTATIITTSFSPGVWGTRTCLTRRPESVTPVGSALESTVTGRKPGRAQLRFHSMCSGFIQKH